MKTVKIIGLSLAIWGSSLIWPEINNWLSQSLTFKLILGLGIALLVLEFLDDLNHHRNNHNSTKRHDSDLIPRGIT